MWNRKELKLSGKQALKRNYWRCVAAGFIAMILLGTFYISRTITSTDYLNEQYIQEGTAVYVVNDFVENTVGGSIHEVAEKLDITDATKGALAPFVNEISSTNSIVFGVLEAVNNLAFNGKVLPGVMLLVGAAIYCFYIVFVRNIIVVGEKRFYLENHAYSETKFDRLFHIYKMKKTVHVAGIMCKRMIYTALWFLTIIGGPIKMYSYRLIPYILAENPDISSKEAFRLSREMMNGNKWRAFVFDLSFILWHLLSVVTFRILDILYVNPYVCAADAELYMSIRGFQLAKKPADNSFMPDGYLVQAAEGVTEYPESQYRVKGELRKGFSGDHMRHYSLLDYVMLFFSFCMIGYIYEVIYAIVTTGEFLNRGTLYGPWLPIYGFGGVITLLLFKRFSNNVVLTFFLSSFTCGVMEYTTAWYLETFKDTMWWDYHGYFMNIQGRVCLEGLIVFGLGCCLGIYALSPTLAGLFDRIPKKLKIAITITIAALFIIDAIYSSFHPNMAAGVPVS